MSTEENPPATPTPSTAPSGKWARGHEFRRFLINTFDCLAAFRTAEEGEPTEAALAPTAPPYVLDVAGGKGDVGIPLRMAGVPCGIVDPRVVDLRATKLMKNIIFHLERTDTKTGDALRAKLPPQYHRCPPLPDVFPEWFSAAPEEGSETEGLAAAKARCDLVVGMHPDQATEPIVDFALKAGKPFAVVPCCVFPRENRHRRVEAKRSDSSRNSREAVDAAKRTRTETSGAAADAGKSEEALPSPSVATPLPQRMVAVENHEQFVRYLAAKTPPSGKIEVTELPFGGRNTVVFWRGPTTSP
jgi:hypothetical protein